MHSIELSFETELDELGEVCIDFTYFKSKYHHDVRINAITGISEAVSGETLWKRISIQELNTKHIETLEKLCLNHADGVDIFNY